MTIITSCTKPVSHLLLNHYLTPFSREKASLQATGHASIKLIILSN